MSDYQLVKSIDNNILYLIFCNQLIIDLLSDQSISLIRSWVSHQWLCAILLCCIAFVLCALLLRALHKANKQRETCKNAMLGTVPDLLSNIANNPIDAIASTTGFLPSSLFGHSTTTNLPSNPNNNGLQQSNDNNAYTNSYDSTYGVTGNVNYSNYSNAYSNSYTPFTNGQQQQQQQQTNVNQPTYVDYNLTSNPSIVSNTNASVDQTKNTGLIDSIYGSTGMKSNQKTAYLNSQSNPPTYSNTSMTANDNEVKNLSNNYSTSMNLTSNSSGQYLSNNLNTNLSSNLTTNLSNNLSSRQSYSQFQSNNYNNSNHLINRQKRLPSNSVIKNLSTAINSSSSSSFNKPNHVSSSNSSSSSSTRLSKNYAKNSGLNNNNNSYNNYGFQNYTDFPTNSSNQQSTYQSTYQTVQQQQFYQPTHHLNRANSTSTTAATEYGHIPLSLPNNEGWV